MLIFFISSSFGRQLNENLDERGRNLMCKRTLPSFFVVPTLLRGEELYTQLGFFLFREFSPLDIFIVES